jgi:hypothetical protein
MTYVPRYPAATRSRLLSALSALVAGFSITGCTAQTADPQSLAAGHVGVVAAELTRCVRVVAAADAMLSNPPMQNNLGFPRFR